MDNYRLLLEACGIQNHGIPEPKKFTYKSYRKEKWIENDLQWYQEPIFGLDYDQEKHANENMKPIHRYCRLERFRSTLYQLLGQRGFVPHSILMLVRENLPERVHKKKIWNAIRAILKNNKERFYYNRIPSIIKSLTGMTAKAPPQGFDQTIKEIFDEFGQMSYQFDNALNKKWSKEYFLNLRFTAFKLMEKHGITYPYYVPMLRTYRKRKTLNNLFCDFRFL